ncbi:ATP-grasp domain-containing protein, partial [Patescibacteria group bacterium]|nr:ATP-grasp domain-containing protein [Patescibacteria group bacterium]
MKPLRILVTDVQELAGLGAVRSLGRAGHIVTAVHTSGFHPAAINSRWCKNSMGYPDPWKFHMQFREWLINELETGKYDAVLPTAEAAIFAVKEIRDQFPQDIIKILPNDEHLKLTLSKFHANKTAKNAGLTTPKTIFVFDGKNECDGDLSSLGFPVIIKTDNSLTSEGTYIKGRTVRVNSQEEADLIFEECKALGCSVIAQEPVKGSGVGVFLLRWNGKTILKFAHQRLHEVPWTGGASSFRKSVHDNELIDLSEKFLESIDYQGAAMIEFRRDGTEGVPYFMEINGRLWGSIALCLHAGLDFPKTLVDCESQGEPESPINKQKSYPSNLKCRNLSGEINYVSSVLKSKSGPSKTKTILEFFA